jgi:hypothetical protein
MNEKLIKNKDNIKKILENIFNMNKYLMKLEPTIKYTDYRENFNEELYLDKLNQMHEYFISTTPEKNRHGRTFDYELGALILMSYNMNVQTHSEFDAKFALINYIYNQYTTQNTTQKCNIESYMDGLIQAKIDEKIEKEYVWLDIRKNGEINMLNKYLKYKRKYLKLKKLYK